MNENKGFIDKRTWIAIVLVTVIWVGWQNHLSKKYPKEEASPMTATSVATNTTNGTTSVPPQTLAQQLPIKTPPSVVENTLMFEDDTWSFQISSKGMGIKNVVLKKYKDRLGQQIVMANDLPEGAFETHLIGVAEPLQFQLTREGSSFKGTALYGNLKIEKTMTVDSNHYLFDVKTTVTGLQPNVSGIALQVSDIVPNVSGSFLSPSTEVHSVYIAHGTTNVRETLKHDGEGKIGDTLANVSVVSLGSLYFTQAMVDTSEIRPEYSAKYVKNGETTETVAEVKYVFPAGLETTTLQYKSYIGPKDLEVLKSIDERLEHVIDYWVLGAIAKPMLKLMKWLHGIFGNWGLAIILLTLIVRSLVMPLYVSSFKSMKAMKKVQPQMAVIREKYKNEPQKMNAEVMKLFRDNKVNPFGGCLPMLLQFPIFIALYRVLSQSIELYQAPFGLWIHDLSIKDPYYVLPVLMGITMFVQQKITPSTTADPAQQKVLQFMPIIFSFMMLSLPSGLTLYIFISTLFGIVQQTIFMKDKEKTDLIVSHS